MLVFTLVSLVIESDILGVIIVRLFFSVILICLLVFVKHCFLLLVIE